MVYYDGIMVWRHRLARLRGFLASVLGHRTFRVVLCVALVVIIPVLLPHVAHAAPAGDNGGGITDPVINLVGGLVSKFLLAIIDLLVGIVLWLVSALISIAKYNDFIHAPPVEIGWVLVRDVVNMFFIVVLLIVAFSTIIGYQPFHYKGVLPKLLLMAVLINFSKTLVGVMIDFSQVVTLTFVNGFQAAAGGNFIQAFQLTKIATIDKTQTVKDFFQVIVAEVLGIWVLVVACTTIMIMLIYFVARAVVLWFLLILSPIAFFGTALPDKMAKAMGAVTKDWWSKLSAALTGGPTVAFFLWLSLAVVQSDPDYFGTKMYAPSSSAEVDSATPAISQAASPPNLFTMVISVALMLTGVATAVSASTALDSNLGKLATSIKQSGGPVGYAKRAAGVGLRASGRVAGATAGFIDRRTGLSQAASKRLTSFAANRAQASESGNLLSRFANRQLAGAAGSAGAAGLRVGAARQEEYKKTIAAKTAGLSGEQRAQALAALSAKEGGLLGLKDRGKVAKSEALGITTSDAYRKQQAAKFQSQGMTREKALEKATEDYRGNLAGARKFHADAGRFDEVDKIDEKYKKDPSLYTKDKANDEAISRHVAEGLGDPRTYFQNMSSTALKDPRIAQELAKQAGLLDANGNLKDGSVLKDDPIGKYLYDEQGKSRGNRGKFLEEGIRAATAAGGGGRLNMAGATAKLSDNQRSQLTSALTGAGISSARMDLLAGFGGKEITPEMAQVMGANAAHLAGTSGANAASTYDLLKAGVGVDAATSYSADVGAYQGAQYRAAHEQALTNALGVMEQPNASAASRAEAASVIAAAVSSESATKQDGEMAQVLRKVMTDNVNNFGNAMASARPDDRAKMEHYIKTVSRQAKFAERKASSSQAGSMSSAERELASLNTHLSGSDGSGGRRVRMVARGGGGGAVYSAIDTAKDTTRKVANVATSAPGRAASAASSIASRAGSAATAARETVAYRGMTEEEKEFERTERRAGQQARAEAKAVEAEAKKSVSEEQTKQKAEVKQAQAEQRQENQERAQKAEYKAASEEAKLDAAQAEYERKLQEKIDKGKV